MMGTITSAPKIHFDATAGVNTAEEKVTLRLHREQLRKEQRLKMTSKQHQDMEEDSLVFLHQPVKDPHIDVWTAIEELRNNYVNRWKDGEGKKLRIARIFVSSTFRDFQAERDYLIKMVFPELKEWAAEKAGVTLLECDLRWGVPLNTPEHEILASCMHELDICCQETDGYPFFLNMLGSRYGWIPDKKAYDVINTDKSRKWIKGTSVTHMEIMRGALLQPNRNALVLLRSSAFIKYLPKNHQTYFMDSDDESQAQLAELKMKMYDWAKGKSSEARAKQTNKQLNESCMGPGKVVEYSPSFRGLDEMKDGTQVVGLKGLEGFGETVLEFFKNRIEATFKLLPKEKNTTTDEDGSVLQTPEHNNLVEVYSSLFVGREAELRALQTFVEGNYNRTPDPVKPKSHDSSPRVSATPSSEPPAPVAQSEDQGQRDEVVVNIPVMTIEQESRESVGACYDKGIASLSTTQAEVDNMSSDEEGMEMTKHEKEIKSPALDCKAALDGAMEQQENETSSSTASTPSINEVTPSPDIECTPSPRIKRSPSSEGDSSTSSKSKLALSPPVVNTDPSTPVDPSRLLSPGENPQDTTLSPVHSATSTPHVKTPENQIAQAEVKTEETASPDQAISGQVANNGSILMVFGEEGIGKTALLALFLQQLHQQSNTEVFVHLAECTSAAQTEENLFLRLNTALSKFVNKTYKIIDPDRSVIQMQKEFSVLLQQAQIRQKLFVIIIDSIGLIKKEGTEDVASLDWLPSDLTHTSNVKIIVSDTRPDSSEAMTPWQRSVNEAVLRVGAETLNISKLSETDTRNIIQTYFKRIGKQLSEEQIVRFISTEASRNPLWLQLACDELRVFGIFEKVTEKIGSLSSSLTELIDTILDRILRQDFNAYRDSTEELLGMVLLSKNGPREEDLRILLKKTADDGELPDSLHPIPVLDWSRIKRSVEGFLHYTPTQKGITRYKLKYRAVRDALRRSFFPENSNKVLELHRRLAHYIESCRTAFLESYILDELPYHYHKAKMNAELIEFLKQDPLGRSVNVPTKAKYLKEMRCKRTCFGSEMMCSRVVICTFCKSSCTGLGQWCAPNIDSCVICGGRVAFKTEASLEAWFCQWHKPRQPPNCKSCFVCNRVIQPNFEAIPMWTCAWCRSMPKMCVKLIT